MFQVLKNLFLFCTYVLFVVRALWLNFPGLCIILMLACLVGIVLYAFYSTCDPIKFGLIMASDQVCSLLISISLNTTVDTFDLAHMI